MWRWVLIQSMGSVADRSLSFVYIGSLPQGVHISLLQLQLNETHWNIEDTVKEICKLCRMVLQGGIQSSRDRGVGTGCHRGQLFWSSHVKAEHCQSLKDEEEMESLGKLELWFAQVGICRSGSKFTWGKAAEKAAGAWCAEQWWATVVLQWIKGRTYFNVCMETTVVVFFY